MGRALYLEAFSGISGNMLFGALLDLGADAEFIFSEINKLNLGNYQLINKRSQKCGIDACYFNVILPGERDDSEQNAHYEMHAHQDSQVHGEEHAPHMHEHCYIDGGSTLHTHSHEHKGYSSIKKLLQASSLDDAVKERALQVFLALAQAEAKVHAMTIEDVHFHEVGAIDTIIDIVGCCLALHNLDIDKVYVSEIVTGSGYVNCAHGLMPVPAPATAELLVNGLYHKRGIIESELTTPTGAALMKVIAAPVHEVPGFFKGQKIGYGAGTKDFAVPNVLRATIGIMTDESDALLVAECNLDDISGELLPYLQTRLLACGAKDVWLTPIVMKKGRPAYTLSVLLSPDILDVIADVIFSESTTLGLRTFNVSRMLCERKFVKVNYAGYEVNVKYGLRDNRVINIAPEYEECKRIAADSGVPLKQIMQKVMRLAEDKLDY